MNVVFFRSAAELQQWLEQNHDTAQELWVGFYKKGSGKTGITYKQALDEALCFGWIDGVRKGVDSDGYTNRFTPRRAKSNWSTVNLERVEELSKLGRMRPAGLKAHAERDPKRAQQYSYENRPGLDESFIERFRANEKAWGFFQGQAAWYQKTTSWWIMSAKKEETRLKRLATLMECSERGQRLPGLSGKKAEPSRPK